MSLKHEHESFRTSSKSLACLKNTGQVISFSTSVYGLWSMSLSVQLRGERVILFLTSN